MIVEGLNGPRIYFFSDAFNPFALVPLAAIPIYVMLTEAEEELLTRRFGEEYTRYRERTGRFLPKL